jgi:prepilin-type N-terminal cleavage/methylation domain-containing protein
MKNTLRLRAVRGFTLIELLIVVIIIAILAAIAIPQFSNSSGDAQEAALDANLATMRSAIELYRVQHGNSYPSAKASTGDGTCTGTGAVVGKGTINDTSAFTEHLTYFSTKEGATCSISPTGSAYIYGPYLRAVPNDPIKNVNTVVVTNGALPAAAADGSGWIYSNTTGALAMNSLVKDRSNTKSYSQH